MEYVTPKFEQKQIVYLVQRFTPIKCVVDELYIHYTVNGPKIMYVLRAYGMGQPVNNISEDVLYSTLEEAKEAAIRSYKNSYSKDKIRKEYKEQLKKITERYEPLLKNFNEKFKETIKNIEAVTEEQYDKYEEDYQKSLQPKTEEQSNESTS